MSRWRRQLVVALAVSFSLAGHVAADPGDPRMSSNNYSINENDAGGMGDFNAASGHYSFQPNIDDGGATLGDIAVGNSSSNNYQTNSGFNTTAQPGLTFIIDQSSINFGLLTSASKTTATATFSAKNYTSYGYAITISGTPPTYSGNQIDALATDTASSVGSEQFGVNTVRNTTAAVGADPDQDPGGLPSQAFGVAGDGTTGIYGSNRPYTVSDKWRFNSGETIASAPKSSGFTDYTMTFMTNIAPTTPAGKYSGTITLICTGTF